MALDRDINSDCFDPSSLLTLNWPTVVHDVQVVAVRRKLWSLAISRSEERAKKMRRGGG